MRREHFDTDLKSNRDPNVHQSIGERSKMRDTALPVIYALGPLVRFLGRTVFTFAARSGACLLKPFRSLLLLLPKFIPHVLFI
jgi:hypothetical protein